MHLPLARHLISHTTHEYGCTVPASVWQQGLLNIHVLPVEFTVEWYAGFCIAIRPANLFYTHA